MAIRWRLEPLPLLKDCGYSTYRIRREKILSETSLQKMRHLQMVSTQDLDTICRLTGKQPGKLIEWVKDENDRA